MELEPPVAELEPIATPRARGPLFGITCVVVVLALGVGAVALASGGTKFETPTVVLSEAATRTSSSGTARFTLTTSVTAEGRTTKIAVGEGSADYDAKSFRMQLRGPGVSEEIRNLHNVGYLSVPGVKLPHGAHWLSISPADVHANPTAGAAVTSNDPNAGLKFLEGVRGDPRVVGKEQLDGTPVTHYQFTLDLKTMLAHVADSSKALGVGSFGAALAQIGSLVDLSAVPGDAWIDTAGRVEKFAFKLDIHMDGESATIGDEFRYSHFNEPVAIPAPPASDTVPLREVPDFFKQLLTPAASD